MGLRKIAIDAHFQKLHPGFTTAMSAAAMAEQMEEPATRYEAFVFLTRNPVAMLAPIPQTTVGKKRKDVCRAERFCTSWKLSCLVVSPKLNIEV
jgi:hypothetical protein